MHLQCFGLFTTFVVFHDSAIMAEAFGFVNIQWQVLVVQEKSGLLRGTGVWKFPTGVVDEVCVHSRRYWFCFS